MNRTAYYPADAQVQKIQDANVEVARWYMHDAPCAAVFVGRRSKPEFILKFRSVERREDRIRSVVDGQRAHLERKAAQRATRKAPNTLAIGDILYTSWGYDQTNVDFYQVVDKPSQHFVVIRPVAQETVETRGSCDYVVPVKGSFTGEGRRVKASHDNRVKISDGRGSAWPWDEQPKYQTAWGFGH